MSFFSDIAPYVGAVGGFFAGGPAGAALGYSLGASYSSSEEQSDAAKEAAQLQAAGGDKALAFQREQYANLAPWRQFGERNIPLLEQTQADYANVIQNPNLYQQSPGYGWLQQQGIDALKKGALASGQFGNYGKDLQRFGQGLALQDYTGYLGRLENLMNRYAGSAGLGQTANAQGQNIASNMGNIAMSQGANQARGVYDDASGRIGMYQNFANLGTNYANQYALNNYLQNYGNTWTPDYFPGTPGYSFAPNGAQIGAGGTTAFGM